ncbi:MAG TPA: ribonuclease HII [Afifellaceae bacterium]|nr:ribonuclease HII [Afifellaceae bacterium]
MAGRTKKPDGRFQQADFALEAALMANGHRRVAGVDEAGRGPLAGPVVAAAVVLDAGAIPPGLADSKTLTAAARVRLYDAICASADLAVAFASATTVDRINIRLASLDAMHRAVLGLGVAVDAALIDGRDVPAGLPLRADAVIGGDERSLSVAAASIIAKVTRDRLMERCAPAFAGYGLAAHKGYPTAAHRQALARLGPCRLHRKTFAPVKACLK